MYANQAQSTGDTTQSGAEEPKEEEKDKKKKADGPVEEGQVVE